MHFLTALLLGSTTTTSVALALAHALPNPNPTPQPFPEATLTLAVYTSHDCSTPSVATLPLLADQCLTFNETTTPVAKSFEIAARSGRFLACTATGYSSGDCSGTATTVIPGDAYIGSCYASYDEGQGVPPDPEVGSMILTCQ